MPRLRRLVFLLACLGCIHTTWAQTQHEHEAIRFDTRNDFGGVGLLQSPSARFAPDGDISFTSGRVEPYLRNAVMLQPLPWAEFVVRYTTVQNRLYGAESFSGDQLYKDRGMDFKLRLLEESSQTPQVALGFRDFLGTGLFSSEYLVASRRMNNFDFTVGVAWGNLGNRGQFKNPFTYLFSSFKPRSNEVGEGGNISSALFHGERIGLFGGLAWRTPLPGITLKVEYDGNDYQNEALSNRFKADTPVNLGVVYSHSNWLDLSLGIERGNTLLAQINLRTNVSGKNNMPKFDPPPPKVTARDLRPEIAAQAVRTAETQIESTLQLATELRLQKFQLEALQLETDKATATVSQSTYRNPAITIGRTARSMAKTLPPSVEELNIIQQESGLDVQRTSIMRKDLENALSYRGSVEEIATHASSTPTDTTLFSRHQNDLGDYPKFSWGLSPALRQHIGGPDDPYIYQIYLRTEADLQLSRHFSLSGALGFDLINNLDKLQQESNSVLPRVRSDIKNYLTEGKTGISRLQADYLSNLAPNWFGRMSAGLLEEMYAGAGGEVLYRPYSQRWAASLDLNRVRQRDFDMRFALRDYEVTTGHLTLHYQLPFYNMLAQISLGQYLAGDRGATVDVSRRFDSGATFGAFFTRTNVSAADFGEGSFDKGVYFSIPLDLMTSFSSRNTVGMVWKPLTRDGGQRLNLDKRLYPLVSQSDNTRTWQGWDEFLH